MFITSMGIFGYLSKAHIEQTSAGEESVAQVERLITEIGRQEEIIVRAETKINALQTSGTGSDANIQSQIDKEQERIDLAFKRIEPAIAQQNQTIDRRKNKRLNSHKAIRRSAYKYYSRDPTFRNKCQRVRVYRLEHLAQ